VSSAVARSLARLPLSIAVALPGALARSRGTGYPRGAMPGFDKNLQQRSVHAMPGFVRKALEKQQLVEAFRARPAYQQNDYLGWIAQAKIQVAMQKRLDQMLDELTKGDVYMGAPWSPPPKRT